MRNTFADILKKADINISREYERLISLYYGSSLSQLANKHFSDFPYAGTCISLDDFDHEHQLFFPKKISNDNIDILLLFCEYTLNLTNHINSIPDVFAVDEFHRHIQLLMEKKNKL